MRSIILDLDGTLVDSVPLHVTTWHDAFVDAGRPVPTRAIHAAIGMGSTRLIHHLLGEVPDDDLHEQLEEGHRSRFVEAGEVLQPTPGALGLLEDLTARDVPFVVATSAGSAEREILLGVLGDPDVHVTGGDSTDDSKPAPDPLQAALGGLGTTASPLVTMVGDSPWDGHAAATLGLRFAAVRSGGFDDAVLREAHADLLVDHPSGLIGVL
ncbi:HAD family hydrolase [Euzebya sp.]|uniref:HAD family hydrolase n=1 Tax=Euzebya sp. TaxID=1971409 RepID=UPI0035198339